MVNLKRILVTLLFLTLSLSASASVPHDRNQYLKLTELISLISSFVNSGLKRTDLKEIMLKDGDRYLKLTQFDLLLDYIESDLGLYSEDLENITFNIDDLSVNSYEYVKNIIESRRNAIGLKKNPVITRKYIANSQLIRDIEYAESEKLTIYR